MSAPLAHSGGHLLVVYLQSVAGLAAKYFVEIDAASNEMGWAYLAGYGMTLIKLAFGKKTESPTPSVTPSASHTFRSSHGSDKLLIHIFDL